MPAVTPWYQGAQVPVPPFLLTDTAGVPQNAAGGIGMVTCTITLPDLTTATPTVANPSTGLYSAKFTAAQAGHHIADWACADATFPGSFTDSFEVQAGHDLTIVSLAEAKEILHQTATTANDAKIQGHNAAVTNWVEYVCGPVIRQTVIERLLSRGTEMMLSKPPVIALVPWTATPAALAGSGIVIPSPPSPMYPTSFQGIPWPATQLFVDGKRGIVTHTSGLPFIGAPCLWQYSAGRPVIPSCIYEASKIALKHLYMVEGGGTGTGTGTGDEETTMTPFGFAVPNRAIEMLLPEMAASRMVAV